MRIAPMLPLLVLALTPLAARADSADPAAADALFREGRRAADAGNYAVACPKFEESYRLDPAPGTLLNLGDCEENRGQLARAAQHFRQLYDQLPAADDRRPIADARARALELRAPKLRIVLVTSVSSSVTRDDVTVARSSLGVTLPVDPGRHAIVVTSAGRAAKRYEVSLSEGEFMEISVSAGEPLTDTKPLSAVTGAPLPAATEVATQAPAPARDGSVQRTAAYVVGGVGIATFVTGTILGVVALSHLTSANAACTGNICSSQDAVSQFHGAQSFAIAADVTLGVGLAFIGTAIFLALIAPHGSSAPVAGSMPMWMGGRF
jgi:hypothetical protein